MALKGTLKEFDVPDILQLLSLQKKTGVLTFTKKDGFITLLFQAGAIAGVDSFPKKLGQRYGNVLVKQGKISRKHLEEALVIQKKTNQKIGEVLKEMGVIDEQIINEALETQSKEIIFSLFQWKHGEYHFKIYDKLNSDLCNIEPIPTDSVIMEGVQMLDEWPQIREVISSDQIIYEPLPVSMDQVKIISDLDDPEEVEGKTILTTSEAKLIKYINGEKTVRELVEVGLFTEYKVFKCLVGLVKKKMIKEKQIQTSSPENVIDLEAYKISDTSDLNMVTGVAGLIILFVVLLFLFSFSRPLKPGNPDNIFNHIDVYEILFKGID